MCINWDDEVYEIGRQSIPIVAKSIPNGTTKIYQKVQHGIPNGTTKYTKMRQHSILVTVRKCTKWGEKGATVSTKWGDKGVTVSTRRDDRVHRGGPTGQTKQPRSIKPEVKVYNGATEHTK